MRRVSGQAARGLAQLLHMLAHGVVGTLVVVGVLVALAAWRLSRGPLELPWLTQRIEAEVNDASGPHLSIGSTALAWEGFSRGVDRPLDLRLTDVHVTGADGRRLLDLPRADVSLSISALLHGRVEPRAIAAEGARLTLLRAADGAISADLSSTPQSADSAGGDEPRLSNAQTGLDELLREFAKPATNDRGQARGTLGQLRRVRISGASIDLIDRQLDAVWHAPRAALDLTRRPGGGLDGTAVVDLALGDQTATLNIAADLDPTVARTHVRISMTPVAPAAVARISPRLAALSAVDAPIIADGTLDLDSALMPQAGRLSVRVGNGRIALGADPVPITDAAFVLEGTPEAMKLSTGRLAVRGHDGGTPTVLQATGTLARSADRYEAAIQLSLDQVAFSDLGRLWPAGVGGGGRRWVVENITAGTARNGRVTLALSSGAELSDLAVTGASGTIDGDGLSVHWLRPVPPLEEGVAQLRIVDPDTLDIAVASGRERAGRGVLTVRSGLVRMTGLSKHDQFGAIQADITGSLPDMISLLKEPRLKLLDKHPVDLRDPAGDAAVALTVNLPLEDKVQIEDVGIHANAHLNGVHLSGIVAGRNLDQGVLDLDVTTDGLALKGQAQLAGIPGQLDGAMDFRAGPPSQILQRFTVTGRPGAGQLAAAGLDLNDTVFGQVPVKVAYTQRRTGDAEVGVEADFTPVTLAVPPTGWRKPIGVAAKGTVTVLLHRDKLTGIDRIAIEGDGISVRGSARVAGGQIAAIRIDTGVFGRSDLRGSVSFGGQAIQADLAGSTLDLAPRLTAKAPKRDRDAAAPPLGQPWTVDARFDRMLLANDRQASGVAAHVENDGRVTRVLHVTGQIGGAGGKAAPLTADITPAAGGRQVVVTAGDAGAVLGGLDVVRTMRSGTLTIRASYDDTVAGHPLSGTAQIDEFRVGEAVGLAKLLQAMTLYGLVDVLRGPGIGFTRLIAPFRYDDGGLTLNDARAFSPSLGLTAKGRIDFDSERVDIDGTIVPAYFFNSLLGKVPLVGKLFSPEQGGGVFAARYSLRGKLDDPAVSVNPLSALTPGFLREIFGIF